MITDKVQKQIDKAPGALREYIRLLESKVNWLEHKNEQLRKLAERTYYAYALTHRPPGYAHCPEGWELIERPQGCGFEQRDDLPVSGEYLFGVVGYDHQLTEDEVRSYELKPLGTRVVRPSI